MADTAPAILNFVRQQAQQGEQWAALYQHLQDLAAIDVDGEQKKLDAVKADTSAASDQLQQYKDALAAAQDGQKKAQETAAKAQLDAQTELDNAAKRAGEIIQEAHDKADTATATADEAVKSAMAERDQVRADIDNLTAQKQALVDSQTKLQADHDVLARKHAALQAALAGMASNI